MRETLRSFKREWRSVLIQSTVTAVVAIALLWGLAVWLGSTARNAQVSRDVQSLRVLVCRSLAEAENDDLVRVVRAECAGILDNGRTSP